MATKVGAFKKDGTVQCVKLVEEKGTSSALQQFKGSMISAGIWKLENNIEFSILVNGSPYYPGILSTPKIILHYLRGTTPDYISMNLDSTRNIVSVISNNENGFIDVSSYSVLQVQTVQLSDISLPSTSIIFQIKYNSITYQYAASSPSSSDTIFTSIGTKFDIVEELRVLSPIVRMCKDGTLKCKELIEEPGILDKTMFNGTISNGILTLDNGWVIKGYKNVENTEVAQDFFPKVSKLEIIKYNWEDGTTKIILNINNGTSCTGDLDFSDENSENRWKDPNDILYYSEIDVYFLNNNANDYSLDGMSIEKDNKFFELPDMYDYDIGLQGYADTGEENPVPVYYKDRMVTPTVRVYKDGTIKCAKLEEATLLPVAWGTPTQVGSYAQFNFPNGYQINVKSIADDSLCNIGSGDTSKYRLNYIYNDGGSVDNLMVFSTETVETTPAFYNSDSYINSASSEYNFGVYTQGVYLEILDPNKKQLGRLSSTNINLSTSFGIVNSEDKEITIQLLDRNTPSWN